MSEPTPARLEPPVSALTMPFWEATRVESLVLQRCRDCAQPIWYPREVCPTCLRSDLDWRAATGAGSVYAVSVQHRPANPTMARRVPYVVALVELDEGVRLMTNVVDCDPRSVVPGLGVAVCWEPLTDGRKLPLFRPA